MELTRNGIHPSRLYKFCEIYLLKRTRYRNIVTVDKARRLAIYLVIKNLILYSCTYKLGQDSQEL